VNPDWSSILQILILSFGIYLVLGFLRTTRGTGLVRGLAVTALLAVVGLYVLSIYLELSELDYLFEISSGYVVIVLAILFQPELRRGIVHLGENPLIGRLLKGRRQEVVEEIVQAAGRMAAKRQGALIAIERQTPLDPYMESAVKVDAEVTSFLLDTIFHHGSALHDGAVVIRGDRVAAAGCLFPLASESAEINPSTGTRHRAALGLTEECDAITIAVSEESGGITLCQDGAMEPKLTPTRLEELLRERLGVDEAADKGKAPRPVERFLDQLRGLLSENLGRKAGALAMATGLFLIANENVRESRTTDLSVVVAHRDAGRPPTGEVLVIVLPSEDYHLTEPVEGSRLLVTASGKRSQFEKLDGPLGGILRIDPKAPLVDGEFPLDQVRWGSGSIVEGLSVSWKMDPPPKPDRRYVRERFQLGPENLGGHTSALGPAASRALPGGDAIERPARRRWQRWTSFPPGRLPLRLGRAIVGDEAGKEWVGQVALSPELAQLGFSFVDRSTVEVVVPIAPAEFDLGPIEKEIRLVALTGSNEEVERWQPLTTKASFLVRVAGIIPSDIDPASAAWIQCTQPVTLFVEDHLRVFVDVGEARAGQEARVRVKTLMEAEWRSVLPAEMGTLDPRATLELVMVSDPTVLLIPR
jgi:diadenylate cyclase